MPMYRRTGASGSSPKCCRARFVASGVSVTQVHPTCALTAGDGDHRGHGSHVEPCWTFLSGTETQRTR